MPETILRDLTLRQGYELRLHPAKAQVAAPAGPTGGYGLRPFWPKAAGAALLKVHDAATTLYHLPRSAEPNDVQNVFRRIRMETSISAPLSQQLTLTSNLANTARRSPPDAPFRYHGSGRPLESSCWPWQASDECDGYLAGVTFRHKDHTADLPREKHLEWIHAELPDPLPEHPARLPGHFLQQMLPPSRQLAELDRLKALGIFPEQEEQNFLFAREQSLAIQREDFDAVTASRIWRDGVLHAKLTNGLHMMAFTCPVHYHPWSTFDPSQYLVTTDPYFTLAREVDAPWVAVGHDQSTRVNIYAVPQRQIYLFQWYTMYIIGTLWWFTYIYRPQTGIFLDAVPWFPYPFSFTGVQDTAINDVACSVYISQSARYALAIKQDAAAQYVTPWSFQALAGRVEGRWTMKYSNLNPGELAAIVDVTRGTATERYFVFRKTLLSRAAGNIDFGPLSTDDVRPFDRQGPSWDFTAHIPYGPL